MSRPPVTSEARQAAVLAAAKTQRAIRAWYTVLAVIFLLALVYMGFRVIVAVLDKPTAAAVEVGEPYTHAQTLADSQYSIPATSSEAVSLADPTEAATRGIAVTPTAELMPRDTPDTPVVGPEPEPELTPRQRRTYQEAIERGEEAYDELDYETAIAEYLAASQVPRLPTDLREEAHRRLAKTRTVRDMIEGIRPLVETHRFVAFRTPYGLTHPIYEGFLPKDAPLRGRVFLNHLHRDGGRTLTITDQWQYRELNETERVEGLRKRFQRTITQFRQRDDGRDLHPLDIYNVAKVVLETGTITDEDGHRLDPWRVAHGYLDRALELDPYLPQTIALREAPEYREWMQAISGGDTAEAARLRDVLQSRFPNAWEFRHAVPGAVVEQTIREEAEAESSQVALPDPDREADTPPPPEVQQARDRNQNLDRAARFAQLLSDGDEALEEGDTLARAAQNNQNLGGSALREAMQDAVAKYEIARQLYRDALEIAADNPDQTLAEDRITEAQRRIFWTRRMMPVR